MLVANYFGGSVAVLPILDDGRLGDAADVKTDDGKVGPAKATHAPKGSFAVSGHDRTHAHMIQSDPSGRFVLHVEMGLDKIFVWKFDEKKGTLTANDPPSVSLPPGDGPRHFSFHPNGRWLYSHSGRRIDRRALRLRRRRGPIDAAANDLDAAGRFRRQQLRLRDSGIDRRQDTFTLATGCTTASPILSVGPAGELKYVGEEWTRGDYPRSFAFDPAGEFLYCCNQRGRQRRRLPGGPQDRRAEFHRAVYAGRQSVMYCVPWPEKGALISGIGPATNHELHGVAPLFPHHQGESINDRPLLKVDAHDAAAVVGERLGLARGRGADPLAGVGVGRVETAVRLDAAEQQADRVHELASVYLGAGDRVARAGHHPRRHRRGLVGAENRNQSADALLLFPLAQAVFQTEEPAVRLNEAEFSARGRQSRQILADIRVNIWGRVVGRRLAIVLDLLGRPVAGAVVTFISPITIELDTMKFDGGR